MRRVLLLLTVAASLWPVWSVRHLPTQDGASHALNARVFRDCSREESPEHEFYARRWSPVPNWTAQALLLGLRTVASSDASEKAIASLYVIGLPAALLFFLRSVGRVGEAALFSLLLLFNRCFFLGFSNYLLSLVLYFVVLGLFLRWPKTPRATDPARLAALLLLTWFTHLFGYLLAAASLLCLAVSGPGERQPRLRAAILAILPSLALTLSYLATSGFFAPSVARRAARGLVGLGVDVPAALHRELFAIYSGAWPLGIAGLAVAALWLGLTRPERHETIPPILGGWERSLAALAVGLFLGFVFVPDHLAEQGGFFKARLAMMPFLIALAFLPDPPRGGRGVVAATTLLILLGFNVDRVRSEFVAANRELEEFLAASSLVNPGETLFAIKPRPDDALLVDFRAAERYCLATGAVCLGNYEAATRHFPVRLRPGVKERLKENRPGTFWADVLLTWDAAHDQLPLPAEPYREVYRDGPLRLYRRDPS